jgi:hypothetical protein
MTETEIEKLNQLVSRTDMSGNQKVEWLVNFIEKREQALSQHGVERSEQLKALFDGFTEWHQNEYGSVYVEIDQFSEYLQSL